MIIVRLQTIVSREVAPGEIAVVSVGRIQACTVSNLIPDRALLELNMRSYSPQNRQRMLAAVHRIVRAECQASGSPEDPDFETVASFRSPTTTPLPPAGLRPPSPRTSATTRASSTGRRSARTSASFPSPQASRIPTGASGSPTAGYRAAEQAGRLQDLPTNHSPNSCPPAAHLADRYRGPDRSRPGLARTAAPMMSGSRRTGATASAATQRLDLECTPENTRSHRSPRPQPVSWPGPWAPSAWTPSGRRAIPPRRRAGQPAGMGIRAGRQLGQSPRPGAGRKRVIEGFTQRELPDRGRGSSAPSCTGPTDRRGARCTAS